ncbi:uncharacterized protein [Diadema antillarum]|uniref:uncharacterized protein n=1 Tax=Diadema antillarum TaxID=105358 RepID=UPI003A8BC9E0
MYPSAFHLADVVQAVMKVGLDNVDVDEVEMEPDPQEVEGDDAKNSGAKNEKKPRQNKSYVTAKTLNDREERRLVIKLNHYQKELKQATYQIDVAQRAIRKELISINPDLMVDPNKGFFVPKGMTQEQAELIKSRRRESMAAANTRSISLDEFTEMRRRKSEMGRQALQAIQQDKPEGDETGAAVVKGRDRWKALSGIMQSNPASFSQMAKVTANLAAAGKGAGHPTADGAKQPPATAANPVRSSLTIGQAANLVRGVTR